MSARTDVWSLGLVLCEICTARYPFAGERDDNIRAFLGGATRRASDVMELLELPDDTPGAHLVRGCRRLCFTSWRC